jgi:hypothetical protein
MRRAKSTGAAALVAAVSVAILLSACGASDPQPETTTGQTFEDHSSAVDEYNAATADYPLPEGETYPPAPFDDENGTYETGYGTSIVVGLWNCSWGRKYLELRGSDPEGAEQALEEFASLADTEAYDLYYDAASVHPVFESAVENARLGDPSLVQSIIDGGCP